MRLRIRFVSFVVAVVFALGPALLDGCLARCPMTAARAQTPTCHQAGGSSLRFVSADPCPFARDTAWADASDIGLLAKVAVLGPIATHAGAMSDAPVLASPPSAFLPSRHSSALSPLRV